MDSKFFTFIKPYLTFIDNGNFYRKPFKWLYTAIAILNLIWPLYVLFSAIDNHVFRGPTKSIVVFLILWLIIAFAGWISFQLWWDRRSKIKHTSAEGDDFVATPVFTHFVRTLGEWLGTWIGIVGFATALLTTIVLGDDGYYLARNIGYGYLESGWLYIIIMPIYGFLIVVVTRFVAEQFTAFSAIANNTKKS